LWRLLLTYIDSRASRFFFKKSSQEDAQLGILASSTTFPFERDPKSKFYLFSKKLVSLIKNSGISSLTFVALLLQLFHSLFIPLNILFGLSNHPD